MDGGEKMKMDEKKCEKDCCWKVEKKVAHFSP